MKFTLLFLLTVLLWSCSDVTPEQKRAKHAIFSTTVPSHLFFKNMRSSYYESTRQANTRIDLYRSRKVKLKSKAPLIYPVIADNWMEDEAYLLIQTNGYPSGFKKPLTIYWSGEEEEGIIKMPNPPDFEDQYTFALKLEKVLRGSYNMEVVNEKNERVPIFESYDQKSSFLTTLRDFKNLIEVK